MFQDIRKLPLLFDGNTIEITLPFSGCADADTAQVSQQFQLRGSGSSGLSRPEFYDEGIREYPSDLADWLSPTRTEIPVIFAMRMVIRWRYPLADWSTASRMSCHALWTVILGAFSGHLRQQRLHYHRK